MKIFIPCRHGLGDVINRWFIDPGGRWLFRALLGAWKKGAVEEIAAFYENYMSPEPICEIMSHLPFPVTLVSTDGLPGVNRMDCNNSFPAQVGEYLNLLNWEWWRNFDHADQMDEPVEIPVERPDLVSLDMKMFHPTKFYLPSDYTLFSPLAGDKNRILHDQAIVEVIKAETGLPMVMVGRRIPRNGNMASPIQADIDLTDQLNIRETLYLAKHATLIVSSLSFFRCSSALFGAPVIELLEAGEPETTAAIVDRTEREYRCRCYGMTPELNTWFLWPREAGEFQEKLREVLSGRLPQR